MRGYYPTTFATAPAVGNAESTRTVSVSATDMSAECMSSVRGVDDHRDRQSMESQEVPYSGTTDCGGVSDTLPHDIIIIDDKVREAAATPPIKPVTTSCLVVPCPTMLLGGRSIDVQQSVQTEWQRITEEIGKDTLVLFNKDLKQTLVLLRNCGTGKLTVTGVLTQAPLVICYLMQSPEGRELLRIRLLVFAEDGMRRVSPSTDFDKWMEGKDLLRVVSPEVYYLLWPDQQLFFNLWLNCYGMDCQVVKQGEAQAWHVVTEDTPVTLASYRRCVEEGSIGSLEAMVWRVNADVGDLPVNWKEIIYKQVNDH